MVKLKTISKFLKGNKLAIQLVGVAAEIMAASKTLEVILNPEIEKLLKKLSQSGFFSTF